MRFAKSTWPLDKQGRLTDVLDHGKARKHQTDIYVSSTDPWHSRHRSRPGTEQPGFDFIFKTGLTNGLAASPAGAGVFDNPDNAASGNSLI